MAAEGVPRRREMLRNKSSRKSGSSTGSESSSTEEEERLRRLFEACDRDRDGFIDRYASNGALLTLCEWTAGVSPEMWTGNSTHS